jgi:hypothetical protein
LILIVMELEFFLRLTVSQPVCLGIEHPFGILDKILSCSSFSSDNYFILRSKASSLTRKRVCSLQCNHSLVRSLTPNHTLPSHLRLCSHFVASYDSQGLRWKYSNPPPHGVDCHGNSLDWLWYWDCWEDWHTFVVTICWNILRSIQFSVSALRKPIL